MRPADEDPAVTPGPAGRPPTRGSDGFFRTVQDDHGRWWLHRPDGETFFLRAVHGISATGPHIDGELPRDPAARLRAWGFNGAGASGGDALRDDGLPFLASADFCAAGQVIVAPGVRLPDVFDPAWPARVAVHAGRCARLADSRDLIGWLSDDPLDWGSPSPAGRPSLLQICLSLEPGYAAYHAAWEFVLALHGGVLDRIGQAWGIALANKEVVRELTRAEEGIGTRGYLRDEARWSREFARRYFSTTAAAIRRVDPNHLVLGCRFQHVAGAAVLAECVYPSIDVSMTPWGELPVATADPWHPVIADNVSWVTDEFLQPASGRPARRLTTVEYMLRKARSSLDRMARHPAVVGYAWARWQDEPGEQPPFAGGLLHVNGREAREHTELLTSFNLRAAGLHHGVRPVSRSRRR